MSKDDYFRIVYLILDYLYSQMKKGNIYVELDNLLKNADLPNIPENYFNEIVKNLFNDKYIDGDIKEVRYIHDRYPRIVIKSLKITQKGIEYLDENTMMKKVAKVLGRTVEVATDIAGII